MAQTTMIWVKLQRHGFHAYPQAPGEVSYLRQRHRHLFYIKAGLQVFHDDREVAFHMFQNWISSLFGTDLELDNQSCEMIAQALLDRILANYGEHRDAMVEVSEDDECGAVIRHLHD